MRGKTVLVTGGTGSFGRHFINTLLQHEPKKIIVFSRDELKQFEMSKTLPDDRVVFFVGDVRDRDRLYRAFSDVDYVVHAAALKQIPSCEYNPFEAIKTNVLGAQNVIEAAIDRGVQKVVALSTDKAANPINLYGATKLCSDKLFVAGNAYSGGKGTRFSVVRYGNVVGSRGSVIPFFRSIKDSGRIPITDPRMTRFWITLDGAVELVFKAFDRMQGGEIFVPKIPSMKITDLAEAVAPDCKMEIVGIRPGEKLHELMIPEDDARRTLDAGDYFIIQPEFNWWNGEHKGKSLPEGFVYSSDNNTEWLSVEELTEII
jgi:UDP-N-acetylglucosamine 4,6-dehydratase/5-epimerase